MRLSRPYELQVEKNIRAIPLVVPDQYVLYERLHIFFLLTQHLIDFVCCWIYSVGPTRSTDVCFILADKKRLIKYSCSFHLANFPKRTSCSSIINSLSLSANVQRFKRSATQKYRMFPVRMRSIMKYYTCNHHILMKEVFSIFGSKVWFIYTDTELLAGFPGRARYFLPQFQMLMFLIDSVSIAQTNLSFCTG